MKNLVAAEWLINNLDKENLIIFDVRNVLSDVNYGKEEYKKGHIPEAIFISVEELLTGKVEKHGGRHPLPDMRGFTNNMNKLGVDDESTVIIYDDGKLDMAGRLWWMLRYIGFEKAYVLLGGFKEWESSGYSISIDPPIIRKSKELTYNLQEKMIADIDDVKEAIDNKDYAIIDSRSTERYRGETEPIDKIPGHIPSALNIPWTEISKIDVKDESKIKEYYKNIEDYHKTIVHCGSGITGTVNVLFMDEIGLSPLFYIGSYSDWISYPENQIVNETE